MIHEELDEYLGIVSRDNAYRAVEVLKRSAYEVTETVMFCGENGALRGPFVRKRIAREAGVGGAYQEMFRAQQQGRRFVHVPRIEDCYELGDDLVVVMEHVVGKTLHELVYEKDPSWALAAQVFPVLCDAVAELHEGFEPPIIHRDLKPSNVIVSPANLTLIDFGIARTYRDGAVADTNAFGTRAYAPPEQFGFGQTGPRSDVYALGMLLYYLLTEKVPSPALAGGAFDEEGVPEPLRPVLSKATAFDPAARYGSARELKGAFEAVAMPAGAGSAPVVQPLLMPEVAPGAARPAAGAVPAPALVPAAGTVPVAGPAARGRLGKLLRLTEWLGVAWNAVVALFMVATVVAIVQKCTEPPSDLAAQPLWLLAWQYGGTGLMFLGAEWCLLDWRLLRRRVRALQGFRWGRSVVAGLIVAAVGFLLMFLGVAVAAVLFPKG